MRQLTCEMCGGTDLIKKDGVFVCQSCNTKYSVEEAKKMMVEGVVDVKGTIQVDNSHLITNFLSMAQNAYDSDNKAEAEMYCNKIIEVDPKNYKAWLIKGQSAGWQSTLANIRFVEAANCFSNAIRNSSEEEQGGISDLAVSEIKNLAEALISLRCQRFEQYPDSDETSGFSSDISAICKAVIQFNDSTSIMVDGILELIANQINISVCSAWSNKISPDYQGDDGRPGKFEFDQYIERISFCTTLIEQAIDLSDSDSEEDIQRYENLITFHENAINACSWDYKYETEYGFLGESTVQKWFKEFVLTPESIQIRRNLISEYKQKIQQINNEISSNKRKAKEELRKQKEEEQNKYWEEHPDEYQVKLENDRIIEEQRRENERKRQERINEANDRKKPYEDQKRALQLEISKLGIFAGKQKKELSDKISEINAQINAIERECGVSITFF